MRNRCRAGTVEIVPSPSRVTDEAGLSALCRALAPEQVQVTYCAGDTQPFRVEWEGELGTVSFAGQTPDAAAEHALAALSSRSGPRARCRRAASTPPPLDEARGSVREQNEFADARAAEFCARVDSPADALPPVRESLAPYAPLPSTAPSAQVDWAEAMRERIEAIEARVQVRSRPRLRLVR